MDDDSDHARRVDELRRCSTRRGRPDATVPARRRSPPESVGKPSTSAWVTQKVGQRVAQRARRLVELDRTLGEIARPAEAGEEPGANQRQAGVEADRLEARSKLRDRERPRKEQQQRSDAHHRVASADVPASCRRHDPDERQRAHRSGERSVVVPVRPTASPAIHIATTRREGHERMRPSGRIRERKLDERSEEDPAQVRGERAQPVRPSRMEVADEPGETRGEQEAGRTARPAERCGGQTKSRSVQPVSRSGTQLRVSGQCEALPGGDHADDRHADRERGESAPTLLRRRAHGERRRRARSWRESRVQAPRSARRRTRCGRGSR